jgi:hypothetical protein
MPEASMPYLVGDRQADNKVSQFFVEPAGAAKNPDAAG